MKKALPFLLFIAIALTSAIFLLKPHTLHSFTGKPIENEELEEEDDMDAAMRQEFELTKDPRLNVVPKERLLFAEKVRERKLAQLRTSAAVSGISWQERGPNNVGGRTRTVMYDLRDSANGYKKVWAGSVGGGLWYTNDITQANPTWNKINDFLSNTAITSLIQNPQNMQEMYAGTGEGWFNSDAIRGLGIFKSTDGGINWTLLPGASSTDFFRIQKLSITPAGTILAATRQGGLQRSTDGGTSWTKVLGNGVGGGNNDAAADIEIASDGKVYVTFGIFGIGGIYRSADDGVTFTKIYTPASDEYRIEIAPAPSNADRMYALVQSSSTNGIKKIMNTTNLTAATPTWTSVTLPSWCDQGTTKTDFTRGQAWYDLVAAVDPLNETTLYVGGVDILKTTNGGTSWNQISQWRSGCASLPYVHADIHALVFRPDAATKAGANTELMVGCDGGIFRSADAGTSFAGKNNSYNVTQYYGVAMHPTNANYFLAGAQDNGTQKFTSAGINTTTDATGGDGTFPHIDQGDGNIQITSSPYNTYFVSTNGGSTFTTRSFNGSGEFVNPTDYDNAGKKLYAANLPNLSNPTVPSGGGSYLRWNNPATGGSSYTIVQVPQIISPFTHVYVSPLTPNRVYFGLNNGSVVRVDSANMGASRTGVVIKAAGSGAVSCIAVDPANENHMLVTHSNYGVISIYETTNANAANPTWSSVEGDLPDMPVRWVMFDPRNSDMAIIATELGVWSTDNLNSAGTTNWSPTNTGLANVRVDMLQYRPSDRTIAAATHGRGLYTAVVPNVTTADVNFNSGIATNSEAAAATVSNCRRYKDYTVQMSIANAPVGIATVTVNVDPSSTATAGVDFDYTTNGDFNSPSNSFTFTTVGSQTQDITVRVYDDAEVEDDEFAKFTYTISGASNAQTGSSYQTLSFDIVDNDVAPATPVSGSYTIGGLNYYIESTTGSVAPFDARLASKRTQFLYKASELIAAGMSRGKISSMSIPINKRSTRAYQNVLIKLGQTTRNTLVENSQFYVIPTSTVKTMATFTPATTSTTSLAYNTFTFDTPFFWDGTSSIAVEICYNNGTADAANFSDRAGGYQDGASSEGNLMWQDNIDCSGTFSGASLGYFSSGLRPQALFNITSTGTLADSTLNASRTEYFAANNNIYFYDTGNVLAKIKNLSAFTYGCTSVTIDRAGNGAKPFWGNDTGTFVMDKTFRVIPTANNSTGAYEVTFYFTALEKQGWEAATGKSFNNIQVIKLPGQISSVTPANPTPDGPGTVQVIAPTSVGTIGNMYYVTAIFNTGFSGFGFGIPTATLPITLVNFTGRLQGDNALLEWTTSSEQNSNRFEIEKSVDGTSYRKIGEVKAAGYSNGKRTYSLLDKEFALDKNYYRLNLVDNDNKSKLSSVVIVRNARNQQAVIVVNNPFKDYIDIRFGKIPQGKVRIQLADVSGRVVAKQVYDGLGQNQLRINVTASLQSKGLYILTAEVDGSRYSMKVMKQ